MSFNNTLEPYFTVYIRTDVRQTVYRLFVGTGVQHTLSAERFFV